MKTSITFRPLRSLFTAAMFVTALMASPVVTQAQNSEIPADVRKDIEALNHQIEQSVQKQDFSSVIDLYTDDATIIVPGGEKIHGRKAIAAYWFGHSQTKTLKSEIVELGGNGKIIYQIGKWTATVMKDGKQQEITTDVVLVWKRVNYDYKIQLNSSNNPVAVNGSVTIPFEAAKP